MGYTEPDTPHKYFALVWTATFFSLYRVSRMKKSVVDAAYDKAVVQAFVSIIYTLPCSAEPHALLNNRPPHQITLNSPLQLLWLVSDQSPLSHWQPRESLVQSTRTWWSDHAYF
jgi:hypothetical protein